MNFRKATSNDIDAVEKIYDEIHAAEARGEFTTGWLKSWLSCRMFREFLRISMILRAS